MGSFDASEDKADCVSCLERFDSISAKGARRSRRVWWKAVWVDRGLGGGLTLRLRLERRCAGCADEFCEDGGLGGSRPVSDETGEGAEEGEEPAASSSRILRMVRTCRMRLSWMMAFQDNRSWAKSSLA